METKQNIFLRNSALEKKFTKHIKAILGINFIGQDINEDLTRGTDFLIYTINPFRVAARLRRKNQYYEKYSNEFTIRWKLPSGVITEIDKILAGWVDYLFYGFVNENEEKIIKYFIGDLGVFRNNYCIPKWIYKNKPYDSELGVWSLDMFPDNFIYKRV